MTGMTCELVDEDGVEVSSAHEIDNVDGGNIVSCIDHHLAYQLNHDLTHQLD